MRILLIAAAIAVSSGCATQSFVINETHQTVPTKEVMQPFFVSGLGQTEEINAAEICGGSERIARVEAEQTFMNGLLATVSSGLYTPRQARVYCYSPE